MSRKNLFLLVVVGDFNVKSKFWYCNDNTTSQGKALGNVTSRFELDQIAKEPTHILDSSSSYIDLILESQPNLIIESRVHRSLLLNLTYKFTIQVPMRVPNLLDVPFIIVCNLQKALSKM